MRVSKSTHSQRLSIPWGILEHVDEDVARKKWHGARLEERGRQATDVTTNTKTTNRKALTFAIEFGTKVRQERPRPRHLLLTGGINKGREDVTSKNPPPCSAGAADREGPSEAMDVIVFSIGGNGPGLATAAVLYGLVEGVKCVQR